MTIKQISIFVENKPGKLSAVTKLLSESNIDIRALSIADTKDFGILRLIVDKPDEAVDVLKKAECMVTLTNVLAVCISDKPGGLAKAMETLYAANIQVEYMYAFVTKNVEDAYVILRVGNNDVAADALKENGFKILSGNEVYDM
ncbi:MAG: ACT domain-containing protein [Oscillospiraceae bacterium]|nr:ACT domain-containing protein [Oscillospiraceae bacterium]